MEHVGVVNGAVGRELPDRGIVASERNSGQLFHIRFRIPAVGENSGRVDPDDQSIGAKYMVLKNFPSFNIVDEIVLEEDHPVPPEVDFVEVTPRGGIERQCRCGEFVAQLMGKEILFRMVVEVDAIVALRIVNQQDLRIGAGGERRITPPDGVHLLERGADFGRSVGAAPDVEPPEVEAVDEAQAHLAPEPGDIFPRALPGIPDVTFDPDVVGELPVGGAGDAVALVQIGDVAPFQHRERADVAAGISHVAVAVAGGADDEIRRSGVENPFALVLPLRHHVEGIPEEDAQLHLFPNFLPRG